MKKEKIVLAFIAALIGLLVAGIIFYVYESTKTVSVSKPQVITTTPQEKSDTSKIFLNISKPTDEYVTDTKVVEVTGKTKPEATVIILTSVDKKVIAPSAGGNFATTINIDDGQNLIEITAIAKTGDEIKIIRTVTFSTEKF